MYHFTVFSVPKKKDDHASIITIPTPTFIAESIDFHCSLDLQTGNLRQVIDILSRSDHQLGWYLSRVTEELDDAACHGYDGSPMEGKPGC